MKTHFNSLETARYWKAESESLTGRPFILRHPSAGVWTIEPITPKMVAVYAEANPYVVYGDYNDRLSAEQSAMLIEGDFEGFDESMWDWEISCSDYADRDSWEADIASEFGFESFEEMPEDLKEAARESFYVDMSDAIRTAMRNTQCHVNAVPLDVDGEGFSPAYGYGIDRETIAANAFRLKQVFGIRDSRTIESVYPDSEIMKVCGQLDLWEIYTSQKLPTHITISPRDSGQVIFHDSFNGSGNLGSVAITKTVTLPAIFQADTRMRRYGIESVYGMHENFWQHDLDAKCVEETGAG